MQEQFRKWLIQIGMAEATALNYANAINRISQHFSQHIDYNIEIYNLTDIAKLNNIANNYEHHGLYRAAIKRYVEFFKQNILNEKIESKEIILDNDISQNQNFSYERDLQTSLCSQINKLFPNYNIFNALEGIEYTIKNRRIDVLLEHNETKDLLAIELKSGEADYKVFGQISMYLGLLKEKFPDRDTKGIIIAGSIQDSLKQAVMITDKIKLQTYKMNIELEEV